MRMLALIPVLVCLAGCSLPKVYKQDSLSTTPALDLYSSFNYWGNTHGSTWFVSPDYDSRAVYIDAVRDELADRMDCDERTRSAIYDRRVFVGMPKWAVWLSWGPWDEYDETRYRTAYSDTLYVQLRRMDTVQLRFEDDILRNWFIVER